MTERLEISGSLLPPLSRRRRGRPRSASGLKSDQGNEFPLGVVIAFDVARSRTEARMSGQLLDVSETSTDLADFSGSTGDEGSATGM